MDSRHSIRKTVAERLTKTAFLICPSLNNSKQEIRRSSTSITDHLEHPNSHNVRVAEYHDGVRSGNPERPEAIYSRHMEIELEKGRHTHLRRWQLAGLVILLVVVETVLVLMLTLRKHPAVGVGATSCVVVLIIAAFKVYKMWRREHEKPYEMRERQNAAREKYKSVKRRLEEALEKAMGGQPEDLEAALAWAREQSIKSALGRTQAEGERGSSGTGGSRSLSDDLENERDPSPSTGAKPASPAPPNNTSLDDDVKGQRRDKISSPKEPDILSAPPRKKAGHHNPHESISNNIPLPSNSRAQRSSPHSVAPMTGRMASSILDIAPQNHLDSREPDHAVAQQYADKPALTSATASNASHTRPNSTDSDLQQIPFSGPSQVTIDVIRKPPNVADGPIRPLNTVQCQNPTRTRGQQYGGYIKSPLSNVETIASRSLSSRYPHTTDRRFSGVLNSQMEIKKGRLEELNHPHPSEASVFDGIQSAHVARSARAEGPKPRLVGTPFSQASAVPEPLHLAQSRELQSPGMNSFVPTRTGVAGDGDDDGSTRTTFHSMLGQNSHHTGFTQAAPATHTHNYPLEYRGHGYGGVTVAQATNTEPSGLTRVPSRKDLMLQKESEASHLRGSGRNKLEGSDVSTDQARDEFFRSCFLDVLNFIGVEDPGKYAADMFRAWDTAFHECPAATNEQEVEFSFRVCFNMALVSVFGSNISAELQEGAFTAFFALMVSPDAIDLQSQMISQVSSEGSGDEAERMVFRGIDRPKKLHSHQTYTRNEKNSNTENAAYQTEPTAFKSRPMSSILEDFYQHIDSDLPEDPACQLIVNNDHLPLKGPEPHSMNCEAQIFEQNSAKIVDEAKEAREKAFSLEWDTKALKQDTLVNNKRTKAAKKLSTCVEDEKEWDTEVSEAKSEHAEAIIGSDDEAVAIQDPAVQQMRYRISSLSQVGALDLSFPDT